MATSPVRIFIDCEFSDLVDMHLISIACVTCDGHEFYAELNDFPVASCNEFVLQNVLPLLGRIPQATRSLEGLRESLSSWLDETRAQQDILVGYDYFGDWALLVEALGRSPAWLRPDNVRDRIDYRRHAEYYLAAGEAPHHALYDARALCHAYQPRT